MVPVYSVDRPLRVPMRLRDGEAWLMLRSDVHDDSPFSCNELADLHLKEAKARDAAVFDLGDLFDAMNGPGDKRADSQNVKAEDAGENYFVKIVRHRLERMKPYAKLFRLLGMGNHETAVLKWHAINLTELLASMLRDAGSPVIAAGYRGYVQLDFGCDVVTLYWTHGSRGLAPQSRGVLNVGRRAAYIQDADIVATGDSHHGWLVPQIRERKDAKRLQWHIQIPSYKNEHALAARGYAIERELPPQPVGCWWLRFRKTRGKVQVLPMPDFQ